MNSPAEPGPPKPDAVAELRSLPSFEDTQDQVAAAMETVKAAAGQMIPALTWSTPRAGSGLGCQGPYARSGGRGFLLPDEVAANARVSEEHWAAIQEAAKQAAAKLDATEMQVMQNGPGNHDVGFYGPAGLFLKVGYRGNLVVSGYTGCRLPHGDK